MGYEMNAYSIVKVTGREHATLLNGLALRKMYNLENVWLFEKYYDIFVTNKFLCSIENFSILMKILYITITQTHFMLQYFSSPI